VDVRTGASVSPFVRGVQTPAEYSKGIEKENEAKTIAQELIDGADWMYKLDTPSDVFDRAQQLALESGFKPSILAKTPDSMSVAEYKAWKEQRDGKTYTDEQVAALHSDDKDIVKAINAASTMYSTNPGERNKFRAQAKQQYMNNDMEGLNGTLESAAIKSLSATSKDNYITRETASAEAAGVIRTLEADKKFGTGPYKALWESAKPWVLLNSTKDQNYVNLMSQIQSAQSGLRRASYGTQITGTETALMKDTYIQNKDSMSTILTKIRNIEGAARFRNEMEMAIVLGTKKPVIDDYVKPLGTESQSGNAGSVKNPHGLVGSILGN
jgi:hypothetical protein